jgi:uncharacterized membrane protein YeiH
MNFKDQKSWYSIVAYTVPIILLAIGNIFHVPNVDELKNQVVQIVDAIVAVVFMVIGFVGVVKTHKKKEK